MENNKPAPEEPNKDESIFTGDEFSMEGYDKHIRQARNALYFTAGILLVTLCFSVYQTEEIYREYIWVDIILWGAFIIGFVFLGYYTKKKPYTAIVSGLILYGVFITLNAVLDVSTLFKGIIMKIAIIVLLVKGLSDAKHAQEMQENFKK